MRPQARRQQVDAVPVARAEVHTYRTTTHVARLECMTYSRSGADRRTRAHSIDSVTTFTALYTLLWPVNIERESRVRSARCVAGMRGGGAACGGARRRPALCGEVPFITPRC